MLPSSVKIIDKLIPEKFISNKKILKDELELFITNCINNTIEIPASIDFTIDTINIKFELIVENTQVMIKTSIICNDIKNKLTDKEINIYRKAIQGTKHTITVKCPQNENNEWYEYIISSKKHKTIHLKTVTKQYKVLKSVEEREKRMLSFGDVKSNGNKGSSFVSKDIYSILTPEESERIKNEPEVKKTKTQSKSRTMNKLNENSFFKGKSRKWGSAKTLTPPPTNETKKFIPLSRKKEIANSIILQNIPRDITKKEIQELFNPYGYIHHIHILYDRYDTSKAYKAFVNFALEKEAQKAVNAKGRFKLRSHIIDIQISKNKKK